MSGTTMQICGPCFGPAAHWEWWVKDVPATSDSPRFLCSVIELIWDKKPCPPRKEGVAHATFRRGTPGGESASWTLIAKANPSRYTLLIGCWPDVSALTQTQLNVMVG